MADPTPVDATAPPATLEPSPLAREIRRLIDDQGGAANADLVEEIVAIALGLARDRVSRLELKIIRTALHEMRDSFVAFAPHLSRRKVSVFGSARTPPDRPEYRLAHAFGKRMAEHGFMVITGAGAGIMRAANEGAGRANSFGCHILLPFETADNQLFENARLLNYKYFFTRKLAFVKETDGLALFPGGFGTLDESFEVLTLIQTGKSELLPVVFIDVPGGDYWVSLERHLREQLLARGLISPEDSSLYFSTTDVDQAAAEIVRFYANFHSIRYVGDVTVLRHVKPVSDALLDALNGEFPDLLKSGVIARSRALPEEANEPEIAALERLVFRFNRRSFGRLRKLVDRLNLAAAPAAPPAPKSEEEARFPV